MTAFSNIPPQAVLPLGAYDKLVLERAAERADQVLLKSDCSAAADKAAVLKRIGIDLRLPAHFGHNLDALYDCMTDLIHKAGAQPGFVVVLEQLPDNPRFDREAREQLIDVFRDAADFWGERRIPFRCFYSFQ